MVGSTVDRLPQRRPVSARLDEVPRDRRERLRSILVTLDVDAPGEPALGPARALAARLDADLVFVQVGPAQVKERDRVGEASGGPTAAPVRTLHTAVQGARASGLRARGIDLARPPGSTAATAMALLAAAEEAGAGLIVAPRDGVGGMPGSALADVVGLTTGPRATPVLLIPPSYGLRAGDGALRWTGWDNTTVGSRQAGFATAPVRLLVGLDGSPHVEAALPTVATFARLLAAEVSLVRVAASSSAFSGAGRGVMAAFEEAATYLLRMSASLEAYGVPNVSIRTSVRVGQVSQALLDQAAREQVSLLVLARRPGSAPVHRRLRSTVGEIVARSAVPVMLIPAADAGAAGR